MIKGVECSVKNSDKRQKKFEYFIFGSQNVTTRSRIIGKYSFNLKIFNIL